MHPYIELWKILGTKPYRCFVCEKKFGDKSDPTKMWETTRMLHLWGKNFSRIVILKSTWDNVWVKNHAVALFMEKQSSHKGVLQLTCYPPLLIWGGGRPWGNAICWEALVVHVIYYVFFNNLNFCIGEGPWPKYGGGAYPPSCPPYKPADGWMGGFSKIRRNQLNCNSIVDV